MTTSIDLLVSDYGGHPFTVELARQLRVRTDTSVAYSFCSTATSPKGAVADGDFVIPVGAGRRFEKYHLRRRLVSELRYGWNTARVVWRLRPRQHVVCNMPIVSLLVIWLASTPARIRLVVWFQDAQSGLAAGVLGRGIVARALGVLEAFLLRRASTVIAISRELAVEATRYGVPRGRVVTIENWAPIDELPARPRDNPWAVAHGLSSCEVLLYSGTLARKHRADLLVQLARRVHERGARVVVVSEGEGAEWLIEQRAEHEDLDNLLVLPYQPFDQLPDVLASADVLVVLLEPNAGRFSVPSKTLSYLCAARPILASIAPHNSAASIIREHAAAGVVVEPADDDGFTRAAIELLDDPGRRTRLGANGRAYAERHFATEAIVTRFADVLSLT